MLHKKFVLSLVLLVLAKLSVFAQIATPQPSPAATIKQVVGLADVEIVYSRPSAKGRVVFGDLVSFDQVWRTGANAATTISFNEEMTIGGTKVPAGKYALFTIPSKTEWTVIINKNTALWGSDGYKQEEDVVRVKVKPTSLADAVETFTIGVSNLTQNGAFVDIVWEKTKISFPIEMDVDSKVMGQISKTMENPKLSLANTYRSAAKYYLDNNKDLNKALEWINESVKIRPDAYWIVRDKALIQAALKDYKGAIETAKLSIEVAKKAKNEDYVKNNEKSIEEWSKMKK